MFAERKEEGGAVNCIFIFSILRRTIISQERSTLTFL